jgi:DNA-binding GntR family transcriptional regulator
VQLADEPVESTPHRKRGGRKRQTPATPTAGAPLRHVIKHALLTGILAGRYAPGQRLLEMGIAAEFDTSQGPVREAFRELEATGLVVNVPRRGTTVAADVAERIREIYVVRGSLEEAATRLATRRRDGDVADLQRHVDAMVAAARQGDIAALTDESVAFHRAVLVSAGNALLLNIWTSLAIETRTTITLMAEGLDLMEAAVCHQPIVDAMARGDAEEAARLARLHQDFFETLPVPVGDVSKAAE